MSLIHNEQIKLTAAYLNGIAIAVFAVGGLSPLFSTPQWEGCKAF